jgi:hypothetical protein
LRFFFLEGVQGDTLIESIVVVILFGLLQFFSTVIIPGVRGIYLLKLKKKKGFLRGFLSFLKWGDLRTFHHLLLKGLFYAIFRLAW